MQIDDTQWQVVTRGEEKWTISSLVTRNLWDVPVDLLEKFFTFLDKKKLFDIIVTLCSCRVSCSAQFTFRELLEARAEAILAPGGLDHIVSLLAESNDVGRREYRVSPKQTQLSYVVKKRPVCRVFYRAAYSISNRKCNTIRRAALGDTTPLQFTPPKYKHRVNKTQLCVGHTHNGNDTVHHCYNNIAGEHEAVTLAEFLDVFPHAWSNEDARPYPVFVEDLYNFDAYYLPVHRPLHGLTRTINSQLYVRAIKLEIGFSGQVELFYKGSPANPHWGGLVHG